MKKFSPRRPKSRRARRQSRSDEALLSSAGEHPNQNPNQAGGDPFPQAPTVKMVDGGGGSNQPAVQVEHLPGGIRVTTRALTGRNYDDAQEAEGAKKAPAASPRGVADVQSHLQQQAARPYRRRADRYADDAPVCEEERRARGAEGEEGEEGESQAASSYYEEEEEGTHDGTEGSGSGGSNGSNSGSSSASSDLGCDRKNARHRRPASRNDRSLQDDDDTVDDTVDDTIGDDDDQSADSYVEGGDLLGTGMLMSNVFAFGTAFRGDGDGDDTLDDDVDDDEDGTVDGDDASVSSRDRRTLKLCYRLASNDYKLKEMDVDCSALTRETAREMAELLGLNTRLERMRIMAPNGSSDDASSSDQNSKTATMANFRHLVGGLAKNASITDLQIRGTTLTREAAGHLGRALAANASVAKLCLRSCRFADKSALPVLFLGMQQNPRVRELYILQCDLSEPCNADVVSASVPLLKLQSLCLIDTRLTLSGLRFLADNLERTPSLAQLNLSINRRVGTAAAIRVLGRVLESTTMVNLTSVSLSSCSLDPNCVGELAESLVDNATLTSLNLSGNRFGDDGARHLRYLLERNHNIKELVVKGCDITSRRQKAIDDGLKYNNSVLKSLFSKETSLSIFDAVTKIEEFGNSVTGAAKEGVGMGRGGR